MNEPHSTMSSLRTAIAIILIAGIGMLSPVKVSAQSFNDVAADYWGYSFIETLVGNGVTAGCGNNNYCPEDVVTRAQMAVFLERGMNGSGFSPPAATGNVFLDVAASDFAANFIEQLASDGITAGCGNNNYCPGAEVTRDQMAVFLLRAKYGASHSPPAASGMFSDVPIGHWAAAWIEQLAAEGITAGCGNGNYCPESPVTRAQMAVFLIRTFGLVPPSPDSDGDFIPTAFDAFPNDPSESLDRDNDGIGDNSDPYKVVYFVLKQSYYDDLTTEVDRFMVDVALDANAISELVIIDANETPAQLRARLSSRQNLWGAFFIGDVPLVRQQNGSFINLLDQYYRSFNCPYVATSDPNLVLSEPNFSLLILCSPNIWVSRIIATETGLNGIQQIADYLDKNNSTRNSFGNWNERMWFGTATAREDTLDYNVELSQVFADHTLYANGDVDVMQLLDPAAQKAEFISALGANQELVKLNVHGAATIAQFQGLDLNSLENMFSSEVVTTTIRTKIIEMESCGIGDYSVLNNFAAELLHAGESLLVVSNPEETGYFQDALIIELQTKHKAYGAGFSHADLYLQLNPDVPRHYMGDPTIPLRNVQIPANRSRMFLDNTHFGETGEISIDFGSIPESNTTQIDVVVKNEGNQPLVVEGRRVSAKANVNGDSINSQNGFIFSFDGSGGVVTGVDVSYLIQPGDSQTISFKFNPSANRATVPNGSTYNGLYYFYTNDPHVGAFKVNVIGMIN